ncbi:MAG: ketopantoate reductase family protein [Rubrobacteraceae bacterium]
MSRVAIVGAGAMGSVYAGLMASAGHEVFAVTLWEDHAEAMNRDGLRVEGVSGDRTVPVRGSATTDGIGICDLVVIATKAADVEDAARSALPLLGPETLVQTIQNGLGSAERVALIIDPDRIAVGVAGGFGASLRSPGHVHHNGMEMVRFGAYAGLPRAALEAGAEVWRSSGFEVTLFEDTDRMVWEKLIMNVAFSATSCLTGKTIGQILSDPNAWKVARDCVLEAVRVAGALGIELRVGDPIEHVRKLGDKIPDARPSIKITGLPLSSSGDSAVSPAHLPSRYNETRALVRVSTQRSLTTEYSRGSGEQTFSR